MGLILTWFTGDLAKTLYFIVKNQPLQFVMCGITQLSIDIYILFQIYTYGKKELKEVKSGENPSEVFVLTFKIEHTELV